MEKKQEQKRGQEAEKKTTETQQDRKGSSEGLPMEESPYLQYKDLEDYKIKGYGTGGHLPPETGRGAGATDAPTPSGSSVAQPAATDVVNRQGVP